MDDILRRSEEDFRAGDANGDGFLDKNEIGRFPFVAKEFHRADGNGDGRISREEFLRFRGDMAQKFRK
jgi:Ca2+-binding EF-hand superfamily protein